MTQGFVLSEEADNDIEEIYEYGKFHFGTTQAIQYLVGLNNHFESIANNPHIGKDRGEIRDGLFSFPYNSHIIFYRKLKSYVRIVRVLYGGRDFVKVLSQK